MVLFYTHKKHIVTLTLLAFLIGLFAFRFSTAAAEDKPERSAKTNTPDGNDPNSSETASDPATTDSPDPNAPASENEDDIFELNPSSLALIHEAYRNIFTPELVSDKGFVKYSTLKRKRYDILAAKRELKQLNPAVLMSLSREDRIAFWINTYNFCTIELILRYYPIQPKWWNILYPDNSIMQITGAWEKEFFDIQREEYNLREIEQNFLLKRYKDPRICFALANASIGGATLRNEPYQAERLKEQLEDQVKRYLATSKGVRWDKDNNILYLSNLFQAYKDTFLASEYATIKKFRDRKEEERTWLNFILPYLSQEDIRYLETAPFKIRFIEVDWHLNESR
ncbi:MAG: DUF547 domain-containing protein [Planctomycetota bacterium]|jgi:hypothetical protein